MNEQSRRILYGVEFYVRPTPSEIVIEPRLFRRLPTVLSKMAGNKQIAIVTDEHVKSHADTLKAGINKLGLKVRSAIVIEPGEDSKDLANYGGIIDKLGRDELGRDMVLIALGGGMIGDLAGFVAATYKRGVDFVQIPTTLLAQLDSSIGGKTGINTNQGKNLIGAFKLPVATFIDPELLATLPKRELVSGLGEAIKYGALDSNILTLIEKNLDKLLSLDVESLSEIIFACVTLKTKTVDMDPLDKDIRQALNFGHTIGHGLEEASGFKLSHGEAIAIGMIAEARIASERGIFEAGNVERLTQLLKRAGLPVLFPKGITADQILSYMRNDKKNIDSTIKAALPTTFGKLFTEGYILMDISEEEIQALV